MFEQVSNSSNQFLEFNAEGFSSIDQASRSAHPSLLENSTLNSPFRPRAEQSGMPLELDSLQEALNAYLKDTSEEAKESGRTLVALIEAEKEELPSHLIKHICFALIRLFVEEEQLQENSIALVRDLIRQETASKALFKQLAESLILKKNELKKFIDRLSDQADQITLQELLSQDLAAFTAQQKITYIEQIKETVRGRQLGPSNSALKTLSELVGQNNALVHNNSISLVVEMSESGLLGQASEPQLKEIIQKILVNWRRSGTEDLVKTLQSLVRGLGLNAVLGAFVILIGKPPRSKLSPSEVLSILLAKIDRSTLNNSISKLRKVIKTLRERGEEWEWVSDLLKCQDQRTRKPAILEPKSPQKEQALPNRTTATSSLDIEKQFANLHLLAQEHRPALAKALQAQSSQLLLPFINAFNHSYNQRVQARTEQLVRFGLPLVWQTLKEQINQKTLSQLAPVLIFGQQRRVRLSQQIVEKAKKTVKSRFEQRMQVGLLNHLRLYNSFLKRREEVPQDQQESQLQQSLLELSVSKLNQPPQLLPSSVSAFVQLRQNISVFGSFQDHPSTRPVHSPVLERLVDQAVNTDLSSFEFQMLHSGGTCHENASFSRLKSLVDSYRSELSFSQKNRILQRDILVGRNSFERTSNVFSLQKSVSARLDSSLDLLAAVIDPFFLSSLSQATYTRLLRSSLTQCVAQTSRPDFDNQVLIRQQSVLDLLLKGRRTNSVFESLAQLMQETLPANFELTLSSQNQHLLRLLGLGLIKTLQRKQEMDVYAVLGALFRLFMNRPPQGLSKTNPSLKTLEKAFYDLKEVLKILKEEWPRECEEYSSWHQEESVFLKYLRKK